MKATETDVILFDGVCNFCNASINFIIERDKNNRFKYASLQSDFGQEFLRNRGLDTASFSSMILIQGEAYYTRSTAALKIAKEISGYKWTQIFLIVPKGIRDFFYDVIAKNRTKIMRGKTDHANCRIPTEEMKKKFLS